MQKWKELVCEFLKLSRGLVLPGTHGGLWVNKLIYIFLFKVVAVEPVGKDLLSSLTAKGYLHKESQTERC